MTFLITCFIIFFFSIFIKKCLNIYQLNIIKKIKKDHNKKAGETYQNLSKEEKERKQQYGHELQKNVSEDEKQKLVD